MSKTKIYPIRMPEEMKERLRAYAEKHNVSMAHVIYKLINENL